MRHVTHTYQKTIIISTDSVSSSDLCIYRFCQKYINSIRKPVKCCINKCSYMLANMEIGKEFYEFNTVEFCLIRLNVTFIVQTST